MGSEVVYHRAVLVDLFCGYVLLVTNLMLCMITLWMDKTCTEDVWHMKLVQVMY